jgi:hypothetical protein
MLTFAISEAAIRARIIAPEKNGLSPAVARAFLKRNFSEQEKAHTNELAQKNQEGFYVMRNERNSKPKSKWATC